MARERVKSGYIKQANGAWFWIHYTGETRLATKGKQAGKPVRVQKWERIVDVPDRYRTKADVIPLINERASEDSSPIGDELIATFAENEYLPWAKANKRPATYNGYQKLWESRIKTHVGTMKLSEYRPHHCSRFLGELAPTMTSASLQHIRALLSGIFSHAASDGRVDVNPIRDAKCRVNPKPSKIAEHYTAAEMKGILSILENHRTAQMVMALAFLGLRPAELIAVKWEDVGQDEDGFVLRVERSMWRGQISEGGKSKHSRRVVPLGPGICGLLERYRAGFPSVSGFILENSIGRPLNTSGLNKLLRTVVRAEMAKHGYNWKTLYAGRHGAVTEVNRHTNGNTQVAAGLFGHLPEIEASRYVHRLPDAQRNAGLALDSSVFSDSRDKQETIDATSSVNG